MLDVVGPHPVPPMLCLQVPVVHGGVPLLADDHPPVSVLVLDDGGDDVQGAPPGYVADLCPGVGADSVVVSLGSSTGAVVTSEHVDSPFHLEYSSRLKQIRFITIVTRYLELRNSKVSSGESMFF